MEGRKAIRSALISVYHKEGLEPIAKQLTESGVTIYSTGGTESFLVQRGIPVERVEDLTSYPSILGGRVKTLHPKVFGGILARRDNQDDVAQLSEYSIPEIDLVIVDLYPFEDTVASGAGHQEIIEKIDIGGISLIRAAAKNYSDLAILSSRSQYDRFLELIKEDVSLTLEQRRQLAAEAFNISSHYDSEIFRYLDGERMTGFSASYLGKTALRYGENPHQEGAFFGAFDQYFEQLHGKQLSYNNLLDIDSAVSLMSEFKDDDPAYAVLKHNNACGLAIRDTGLQAYKDALAGDPVSAFGGVIITNQPVDADTANELHKLFFEVLIAPGFSDEALEILKQKKNRMLLHQKGWPKANRQIRSALGGALVQRTDDISDKASNFETKTKRIPSKKELSDLEFAQRIVKHTRSNAIVLAKDRQLLGSGTGQTSRVDALEQAIAKARHFNLDLIGAVMSSDAFFPFPDCVEIAQKAGISAVIQPGGSVRDEDSINYCDEHDMAMVFTGIRHFKH